MSIRRYVRATVALIAAYAVALQTILLVFAGAVPGATQFAATPICSAIGTAGTGSVPPGHSQDCLAACLTGCCCGAAAVPVPGTSDRLCAGTGADRHGRNRGRYCNAARHNRRPSLACTAACLIPDSSNGKIFCLLGRHPHGAIP